MKESNRRAVLPLSALFGACLLLGALAAAAQAWRGESGLEVRVSSRRGGSLAGARVEMMYRDGGDGSGPAAVATDSKGRAALNGLAAGTWQIEVSHPDFMSYVAVLRLSPKAKPEITASFLEATGESTTPIQVKLEKSRGGASSPPLPAAPRPEPAPAPAPRPTPPPEPQIPEPQTPEPEVPEPEVPEPRIPEPRTPQPEPPVPDPPIEIPPAPVAEDPTPAPSPPPPPVEPGAATPQRPAEKPPVAAQPVPETPTPEPPMVEPPAPEPPVAARPAPAPVRPEPRPPEPEPTVVEPPAPAEPADAESGVAAPDLAPPPAAASPMPAPETPAAEPAPPAATRALPPAPAPQWRAYQERTCPECRPGEWAVTVAAALAAPGSCTEAARDVVASALSGLASRSALELAGFAGGVAGAVALLDAAEAATVQSAFGTADGGGCRILGVVLPKGSRFVGFQYEVEDAEGRRPCLPDQPCPGETAAFAGPPRIARGASSTVIHGLAHGAGGPDSSRAANALMTVFFRGPNNAWTPER